jgi:zinc transporter, ZIP family
VPTGTILLLGAFAGLTIYFGLPLAFLKQAPQSLKSFLSMLATGVLLFLLYDVISKASEPIVEALDQVRTHQTGNAVLLLDIFLLISGLVLGLIGLVYFNKYVIMRLRSNTPASFVRSGTGGVSMVSGATRTVAPARNSDIAPQTLALIIATGIGLHNFSEGLAIGQSAAAGALQLAVVLIIGFGLHNMTEGFGIAGPVTGRSVSWRFIGLVGLIGGGPTFLGTAVGIAFYSPQLFVFFLALAAGAIIYVVAELFGVAKRFTSQEIIMWGLLGGFLLGYASDLIVTFAGA